MIDEQLEVRTIHVHLPESLTQAEVERTLIAMQREAERIRQSRPKPSSDSRMAPGEERG
jgi:hypothetical protein